VKGYIRLFRLMVGIDPTLELVCPYGRQSLAYLITSFPADLRRNLDYKESLKHRVNEIKVWVAPAAKILPTF
jgi:hypothetical protein